MGTQDDADVAGGRGAARAVLVLGTAAQSPTRERAHNAAVLRWEDELILFDPGEGAQRQLALGHVSAARIDRVCITHLHGDHCLGLPGFVLRRSMDGVDRPLDVHFPAAEEHHVRALLGGTAVDTTIDVRLHGVPAEGGDVATAHGRLIALPLDHTVPTVGYRLEEPDRPHLLPDRLAALGIRGERVHELEEQGHLEVDGRTVDLDEVSRTGPGPRFAFVMDTRRCASARALAADVDLLVCESTFLAGEEDRAAEHGHLTAGQAAELAAAAGAQRLVLTHYSSRHTDSSAFAAEAAAVFPEVVAADDLTWVPVPNRPRPHG